MRRILRQVSFGLESRHVRYAREFLLPAFLNETDRHSERFVSKLFRWMRRSRQRVECGNGEVFAIPYTLSLLLDLKPALFWQAEPLQQLEGTRHQLRCFPNISSWAEKNAQHRQLNPSAQRPAPCSRTLRELTKRRILELRCPGGDQFNQTAFDAISSDLLLKDFTDVS